MLDASRKTAVLDFQVGTELLVLYDFHDSMKLLAIMSHVFLMNARVAAPTALSVRHLSNEDSRVLGFFGAGRLAGPQIKGVLNERRIEEVRLCSRTPERRDALAERLKAENVRPNRHRRGPAGRRDGVRHHRHLHERGQAGV